MLSRTAKSTAAPSAKKSPRARRWSGRSRSAASRMPPATIATRTGDEAGVHGLPEQGKRDAEGEKRGGADGHRRPRSTRFLDRAREEDLREPGREQAREEELPRAAVVMADDRRCECDDKRDDKRCERAADRAGAFPEPDPDHHGHGAERRRRRERQEDRRHAAVSAATASAASSSTCLGASRPARTIPAMIAKHPAQRPRPSRSPASQNPKIAAQTGSRVKTTAVCVALVNR